MFNDYLPMVNCKKSRHVLEGLKYVHLLDEGTEILGEEREREGEEEGRYDDSINFEMVNEELCSEGEELGEESCFTSQCAKIYRLSGTKMYYFLRRCLEPKGDKRKLFYI